MESPEGSARHGSLFFMKADQRSHFRRLHVSREQGSKVSWHRESITENPVSQSKTTWPAFIQEGLDRRPGGVLASVKRGGEWVETDLETFRTSVRNFAMGLYELGVRSGDRKITRLNSSHVAISYAVFCLKRKRNKTPTFHHR